jgi:ATP-dependent helicase HrpA
MLKDVQRFRRQLKKIQQKQPCVKAGKPVSGKSGADSKSSYEKLSKEIEKSISIAQKRREQLPVISYPAELPIAQKQELIKETISNNQVTILCGETGSGKTTQLPKICLDLGLGVRGKIGHTQPRRLAARAVSQRIAEELGTELGEEVGYKVRFSDQSGSRSYIKLMTDGILLAECNHDAFLNEYDTIIIDEAHERSLNIDFLLGYLKRLIKKRKDLKIIITSATIDPDRFSRHFGDAPVINVSGRTYPVEVLYRPYLNPDDNKKDLQQAIIDAVLELSRIDRGDILVFLSGERDIRETADALNRVKDNRLMSNTEVLPLLARLSSAEQNRIFHTSNSRRIILSTNVAETSLTVPGIRYVIDSGLARISRYSWRSKIQRLPIEKISQASADQRKGRCGRVANGICIRLYDEEDFQLREEFTEPEIRRTNLAAVILQMENLKLGHIDDFPFVEPPEERLINDGYKLLQELDAITGNKYEGYRLTKIGRMLARLPIDPKLSRMLIEAGRENVLSDVLIIVSALAVQDPRDRPMDKQQAADEKHAAFRDKDSDFVFYLNLWAAYHDEKQQLSGNQLRKWCRQNFISWMRMREWLDTHRQIKNMVSELGLKLSNQPASYEQVHRSLLSGLLANIGCKKEAKEFIGARNRTFKVFPGSALFKKPPAWIVSSEIVETSQVYARNNARIDVQWLESIAGHLLKHHYKNPHWEKKRSQVVASRQSTLYGLIVIPDRKVNYARIDAVMAREIFIRSALVDGDYESTMDFYTHNRQLVSELEAQEAKSRRRDIVVDAEDLFQFYEKRLPADINSGPSLEKLLRQHPERGAELHLRKHDLIRDDATFVSDSLFPDTLEINGSIFPVEYHFDPNHHCDGVTLVAPLVAIDAINPQRCEWLIPGLLVEKITALIRSLPKSIRKNFVPAPNFAEACAEALQPSDVALSTSVANQLRKMTGVQIPYDAWNLQAIDQHLLMNFRIIDADDRVLKEGRDLASIRQGLSGYEDPSNTGDKPSEQTTAFGEDDVGPEIIGTLDEVVELKLQGVTIKAYPALVKDGKSIHLRALEDSARAHRETCDALRQMIMNALPEQIKHLKKIIDGHKNLCLKYSDFGNGEQLKRAIISSVVDEVFHPDRIESESDFLSSLEKGKAQLQDETERRCRQLAEILDEYRAIRKKIKSPQLKLLDTVSDIQQQLNHLFPENFLCNIEQQWLRHYPRYLSGISKRLEKAESNPVRDRALRHDFSSLWQEYEKRQRVHSEQGLVSAQLEHYRWLLEEYRISLFAQELKTAIPVSEKRLKKFWDDIADA